jgi:protein SCO1/2
VIFLAIAYRLMVQEPKLKVWYPADVNPKLVDTSVQFIRKDHQIADFSFINQNGETITNKNYEGKIYVADFFFTTCPSICPIMKDHMVFLQKELQNNPNVLLLSHTVMPEIDSVQVLKAYALKKGVDDKKWNLVTGNKKDIFYLARTSYLAVETGNPEELYDMVHTENFVLVDPKRQVRGFYDGTSMDDMKKLLNDIQILEKEFFPKK